LEPPARRCILHLHDLGTGATIQLNADVHEPQPFETGFLITVREGSHGQDLNGDGDLEDGVIHIVHLEGFGPPLPFRRGDSNADGRLDLSDAVFTLGFLFTGGDSPACRDSADGNDDGQVNISDAISVLNHLFLGGPEPPAPGKQSCGPDAGVEEPDLGCVAYAQCL
jgi:hypothetical protein